MEIYGKFQAVNMISSMAERNRLAHSFLIYGDEGVGKKTLAKYFVMKIMCENKSCSPCGKCKPCHNIEKGIHPDVIYAEHSGKLGGISIETAREISSDTYIRPNNGDKKIYIFEDADKITIPAQNSLLKLIEEPPQYAYFIFTAKSKSIFLTTILSRVVSIGVSECSLQECYQALSDMGFDDIQIKEAQNCFKGNIGMCIGYLKNDVLKGIADLTKRLTDCIINKNEYDMLKAFTEIEKDRLKAKNTLLMLDRQFRDTAVNKFSSNSVGCYPNGAVLLSENMSFERCIKIHELISEAYHNIDSNVNLKLITAVLCGDIMKG